MEELFKVGLLFGVVDELSKPVEKIKQVVGAVKKPVEAVNNVVKKLGDSGEGAAGSFSHVKKRVDAVGASLKRAYKGLKDFAGKSEELKKKFDSVRDSSAKLTLAGGAITAPFAGLSFKAMNFNEGLSEVSTMLDMTVGEVRKKYNQEILGLAVEIGKSPDLITQAMYQGLSAGISPDAIIDSLRTSGTAAVGGKTGIVEAVDGLTTVMNAYGSKSKSITEISDLMFMAVQKGKTTFGELAGNLHNVLSSATGAGIEFSTITAAIATLTSQGTPTAVATTKIRSAIDELANAGTKTNKLFSQLSGQTFREFIAGGGTLQEALLMLERHAKSNGGAINDLFGSVEAGGAALALTGEGTKKFTSDLAAMANSAQATEGAFKKMTSEENTKFRWDQFMAGLSAVSITLGQLLLPSLNKILTVLNSALSRFQAFTVAHPKLAQAIMLPVAALGMLLTGLGSAGVVFGAVGGGLMRFITVGRKLFPVIKSVIMVSKTLIPVIRAVSMTLLTSPVFWVIAGIVALVAAGYLLVKHWDKVKLFFVGLWARIRGAFQAAWDYIRGLLASTPGWVLALLAIFVPVIGIPALIIKYWDQIKSFFAGIASFLAPVFASIVGAVRWVGENWRKLLQIFLWTNPISGPIMAIRKLINYLSSINLYEAGAHILGSLADGLRSAVMAPLEAIQGVAGKIRDFLPHSPAKVGPLSDLDETGGALVKTVAGGISPDPVVERLSPVASRMADILAGAEGETERARTGMAGSSPGLGSLPGAGLNSAHSSTTAPVAPLVINYSPTIYGGSKEEIRELLAEDKERLRSLVLEIMREHAEERERRRF